ncbi:MAG: hypothetical protein QOC80_1016 [Frankiaceae bacterium]|nr:hypothetical protein [Frankiaceae bacterium]
MSRSVSHDPPADLPTAANAARTGPFTRRRVVGLTAALAGGIALAVPGVASLASEPAAPAPTQNLGMRADPAGPHAAALAPAPKPVAPNPDAPKPDTKPATAKPQSTANGAERASRSNSRTALPAKAATGGSPKAIAQAQLASRGWSGQFSCLNSLWAKESGWSVSAANPSGAYGIPQALPGSKMATVGSDWRTNPATQIEWGLDYISSNYGSPCGAWAHSQSHNWY